MMRRNGAREDGVGQATRMASPATRMTSPAIPDKLRFRIGEVAQICEVPSYVLRFWEREFPQLRPGKGQTGQRLYRRRDVAMALRIKALLYGEGYTIPGARQALRGDGRPDERMDDLPEMAESAATPMLPGMWPALTATGKEPAPLRWVKAELREILVLLDGRGRTEERGLRPAVGRGRRMADPLEGASATQGLFAHMDGGKDGGA